MSIREMEKYSAVMTLGSLTTISGDDICQSATLEGSRNGDLSIISKSLSMLVP